MSLSVVVLAAGRGVRMHSDLPKVLHPIAGQPMLERIVNKVGQLEHAQTIIVYGDKVDLLKKALSSSLGLTWVEQAEQLGTGHAVLQALPEIASVEKVLILYGDVPLISVETLKNFIHQIPSGAVGLLTVTLADPTGFGRIVRDTAGSFIRIAEEKDATVDEKRINEVNAGIYVIPKNCLEQWLPKIEPRNAQGEYYLPDILPLCQSEGVSIVTIPVTSEWEVIGVNDKIQLAAVERYFQETEAKRLMRAGVSLADPNRFDLRGEVTIGKDVSIDINVILEGQVKLGNKVKLGPNVLIKNSVLADNVEVFANSVIEGSSIAEGATVGPFGRVRPGTEVGKGAKIGNFVEIKNAVIGDFSKINHLSYVGDAFVGESVNIGAGTITCNFDGKKKHKTVIGKGAFIGSNTQLIAPVSVGENATVGAGTTVTKNVPDNSLVHHRFELRCIENWANKIKEE